MAVPNIFTDKAVGIAFAAAFALWAWYLNSLAGVVMEGVESLRVEQKMTQTQIQQLKAEIVQHQMWAAESGTRMNERQQQFMEFMRDHQRHHELEDGQGK
jgi:hypothetical protein